MVPHAPVDAPLMPARRLLRPLALLVALLGLLAPAALPGPVAAAADVHAAASTTLTGNISGPTQIGVGLKGTYEVRATGGPAIAANGTQVGIFSYQASIVGINTTSATLTPSDGVLVNGTTNLSLVAPNITESLTLYVDVTSNYSGQNQSTNLTYDINVIVPITLAATLTVVGPTAVKAFDLTVQLDGATVGAIHVPSLTAGQSYPVTFSYVGTGLSPGWHTFTISLAQEHGAVVFRGGAESYSASFYVPGPPPNYAYWYLAGAVAFAGAVFIWVTRVGARRRPKAKS